MRYQTYFALAKLTHESGLVLLITLYIIINVNGITSGPLRCINIDQLQLCGIIKKEDVTHLLRKYFLTISFYQIEIIPFKIPFVAFLGILL